MWIFKSKKAVLGNDLDRIIAACREGRLELANSVWLASFLEVDTLHPAYKVLLTSFSELEFQATLAGTPKELVTAEALNLFAQHDFAQARRLVRHFCSGRVDDFKYLYAVGVRSSFMLEGLEGVKRERDLVTQTHGVEAWLDTCCHIPPNILKTQEVIAVLRRLKERNASQQLEGYLTQCLFMANEDLDRMLTILGTSDLGISGSTAVQMACSRVKDYVVLRSKLHPEVKQEELWQTRCEFDKAIKATGLDHCQSEAHSHLKPVLELLAKLEDAAQDSLLHSASCYWDAKRVVNILKNRIRQETPTSLIRLGDGEGRFLPYPDDIKEFLLSDRRETESIWWGERFYSDADALEAEKLLKNAICNADFLGVPPFHRCVHSMGRLFFMNTPNARGLRAILEWLSDQVDRGMVQDDTTAEMSGVPSPHLGFSETCLVSSHIHTDLFYWNLLGDLLSDVSEIGLVSCHDLTASFKENYGIDVKHVRLTAEHKYKEKFGHTSHHDDPATTYVRLRDSILEKDCKVNLIAAGFLGKLLCNDIKLAGNIAIDVGSIADYLVGHPTRISPIANFQ
ncbi:hypothetical protein EI983_12740 [Roseovarius faecimaris]|uniref:Uncharacterized protein n=1 Tax=Roseovarius faecimaris TaxID=2494550 RepID=A0A6I6IUN8_9RHOB|nr:hypothetical protein [Roseovarius faecimaris]QGX99086.1 hypothetical protein EI983_12740 [Roseovarius faecimaris]